LDTGASADARPGRPHPVAAAGVFLVAALLLSIGLTRDWRLLHEDNGAFFTTLALSHLRLGLAGTRAHDIFVLAATGQQQPYGHHPPGVALLLAAAFRVAGSDAPAVARGVAIAFHLGSLVLLMKLLSLVATPNAATAGGLAFAILPMSAYFGRMVGYEPFGLFSVFVQLLGWTLYRRTGGGRWLLLLGSGVVLGGLLDWAPLFFTASLGTVEAVDLLAGRRSQRAALAVLALAGIGVGAFDLAHFAWAGRGAVRELSDVFAKASPLTPRAFTWLDLAQNQLDVFRRYFTHTGLVATALLAGALVARRGRLLAAFGVADPLLSRLLASSGGAGAAYILAAPAWAKVHPYWQFYLLPFAATAVGLAVETLLRRAARSRRALALLGCAGLEVLATSAYTLHLRHTRVGVYAVEQTRVFRSLYLRPKSAPGP
jgi:hypothetical protein